MLRPTSRRSCVGFVSHMFFHCHEMRLHCFLLSVAWFQLALISSECFESFFNLLSMARSITAEIEIRKHKLMFCVLLPGGVVSAKALYLRLSTNQVFILNGVVATRRNRVHILLRTCFFPSSIFFSFLFCFVCLFVLLLCFAVFCFCLFLNIPLNK